MSRKMMGIITKKKRVPILLTMGKLHYSWKSTDLSSPYSLWIIETAMK